MPAASYNDNPSAAPASPAITPVVKGREIETHSYGQILKSTSLIGGSSVLSIAIRIVQTKAMAVMLGPAGFGLMGVYTAIIDLALAVTSLGIGSSGVRQIAESAASEDRHRIARTVIVLRRTAVLLGILGAALLVAFSGPVSRLGLGSEDYAGAVALLGLAVFFRSIAAGQSALIQGLRRISDLARLAVVSALTGAFVSTGFVFCMGEQGMAPALIGAAALGMGISWWYSRRIQITYPAMTLPEIRREAGSLIRLGLAFMVSGILTMGASFADRAIVLRLEGFDAAGFYSAAWTLGGLYVGIILQAMGADFYPRLVGAAHDDRQCNRLVNEQTRVSLLLAGPGVIATVTFAPLIIGLFYSDAFHAAVEILRWICLGIALRVITWPIGFIIIAKNRQGIFIVTELAWTITNVGLTWVLVKSFGPNGAGVAFFASYIFHGVMLYPIVSRLTGYRWLDYNLRTAMLFLSSIALVFVGFYLFDPFVAYSIGTLAFVISGVYAIRTLLGLVSVAQIPVPIHRLLVRFRLI